MVNGAATHPIFEDLKQQVNLNKIGWNFNKFLVDNQGRVIKHASAKDEPYELEAAIQELLK